MNSEIQQSPIAAQLNGYRIVQAIEVHWLDDRPFPDAEKSAAIYDRAVWLGRYFDRRTSLEHPSVLAQAIEQRKLDREERRNAPPLYDLIDISQAIRLYRDGSKNIFFDYPKDHDANNLGGEPNRILRWYGQIDGNVLDTIEGMLGGDWWRLQPDWDLWVAKQEGRSC